MRHSLGRLEVREVATGLQGAQQLKAMQTSLLRKASFLCGAFDCVGMFAHLQFRLD